MTFLRLSIIAALGLVLSACQTAGTQQLVRSLPAAPAYARPVLTADPKQGEDVLIIAARERLGRAQANCVITNFRNWYDRVREAYESGGDQSALVRETEARCGKLKK